MDRVSRHYIPRRQRAGWGDGGKTSGQREGRGDGRKTSRGSENRVSQHYIPEGRCSGGLCVVGSAPHATTTHKGDVAATCDLVKSS